MEWKIHMNKVIVNHYIPDYVSPPGETLLEILEERRISIQEFAEISGIATENINALIKGEAEITAGLAINLEQILGIPSHFWLNREKNYRDALARH